MAKAGGGIVLDAAEQAMTVIAMTREIGSHGLDISSAIARELGLRVVNSEIVASRVASNLGVKESAVQRYLQGAASLLERWQIDKRELSRLTAEEIFGLAQQGDVLIRGWGVSALFRDVPQILSVRICAPMAVRELVLMERLGTTDLATVRDEIERYDSTHTETIQATFGIDGESPGLYDVVLNSGRFSVHDCVKIVCEMSRNQRFQDQLAMQMAIADKLLALRVRSALEEKIGPLVPTISVSAMNGRIRLGGVTSTGGLSARAERVAREVAGVHEVESYIDNLVSRGREVVYPHRTVRMIGAFAVDGTFDVSARLIGEWLTTRKGQQFVTENRLGQRGYPTSEAFARVPIDAHSLLLVGLTDIINSPVYDNQEFNLARDVLPVAGIVSIPCVMVVNPSLSATTVTELIALAKARPARLKMASAGHGSLSHALGVLFAALADIDVEHMPRKSGMHGVADLLAEQVDVMFFMLPGLMEYIKAGKLRSLAVTTSTRVVALPDVPSLGEFLPGYEATGWQGLCAPKNTSTEIVAQLNHEINAALTDSNIRSRLARLHAMPLVGSPADFRLLIERETEKWSKLVQSDVRLKSN
jgi:tripartite-type tricarboxylate transporter receptor subunit TctC/cytidylate kinase